VADGARAEIERRRFLQLAAAGAGGMALTGWGAAPAFAAPASATEVQFADLDGTPLHFWRFSERTAGRRVEQRTFASTGAFHDRLVRWVQDLRDVAWRFGGFGEMQRIVTAGIFVEKPGQHGLGQAMDLDQVQWANGSVTPYWREHESADPLVVRRYLALDAICRRHFRYVLDGRYNEAHADHLHMDFGGGAIRCDRASRSDTVFVQQVCNAHMDAGLAISGDWDRATNAAFTEAKRRLGVGGDPHTSASEWRWWLFRSASCGFADVDFTAPPADVVDPLRELVDHVGRETLKGVGELAERLGLL
jgi:hypothetical protein